MTEPLEVPIELSGAVSGEPARISFERSRVTSRRVEAGSRLVVVLDVIKDGFHEINYGTGTGTGADVADESIADAEEALVVQWRNGSVVRLPIRRLVEEGASR